MWKAFIVLEQAHDRKLKLLQLNASSLCSSLVTFRLVPVIYQTNMWRHTKINYWSLMKCQIVTKCSFEVQTPALTKWSMTTVTSQHPSAPEFITQDTVWHWSRLRAFQVWTCKTHFKHCTDSKNVLTSPRLCGPFWRLLRPKMPDFTWAFPQSWNESCGFFWEWKLQ